MVLILGALPEETAFFVRSMTGCRKIDFQGRSFYSGYAEGREVVAGTTGAGKVQSAVVSQAAVDRFSPDAFIFTGTAGALDPDLEIGDIVIGAECLQHDMDCTSMGFRPGEIPFDSDLSILKPDERLFSKALSFVPPRGKVAAGRILTGDLLVKSSERKKGLFEKFGGDAVEMEGFSAAFAAKISNIPFLLIRVISDKADCRASSDFKRFLKYASETLCLIVGHILK